jgi:hypothetical protein
MDMKSAGIYIVVHVHTVPIMFQTIGIEGTTTL